jgi:hypothetical protein
MCGSGLSLYGPNERSSDAGVTSPGFGKTTFMPFFRLIACLSSLHELCSSSWMKIFFKAVTKPVALLEQIYNRLALVRILAYAYVGCLCVNRYGIATQLTELLSCGMRVC